MKMATCFTTVALVLAGTTASAAIVGVDSVDATPTYSSVTVGGTTIGNLVTGDTLVLNDSSSAAHQSVLDVLDIGNGVSGTNGFTDGSYRTTNFGGSTLITDNDADADFFVFEDTGNDSGTIQAVLADGSLGATVAFTAADFGPAVSTSGTLDNNGNSLTGRTVVGMSFHFTDLLGASGANLTAGTAIQGIFVDSASALDVYSISANVEAVPEPGSLALLGLGGLLIARRRRG